jgi:membrane-associated phospholipid phosphatase
MRKRTCALALTLSLAIGAITVTGAQRADAQSVAQIVGNDFKHAGEDFIAIWASPIHGSSRDWLITAAVLGGSALISPLDDDVDRWAVRNEDRGLLDAIRPFRRGGAFYTVNKLTPYAAGAYVLGVAFNNQGVRDGILGCLSAYGANTTIRHQLIYRIAGRERPELNKDVGGDVPPTPPAQQGDQYDFSIPSKTWGEHSFPGGHVANIATCAAFFSHRFDWGLAEPLLAGFVAAVGVGRLADRGHWLSDQVVGTVFGYAIGREVARRQLARLRKAAENAPTSTGAQSGAFFAPGADVTRIGMTVRF